MAPSSPSDAGSSLPEGTVTVMVTDLVASTPLNQRHGDDVANAIERDVLQCTMDVVGRHQGVLVKGTGDGVMIAFQSARRAVACAREIQLVIRDRNRAMPNRRADLRIGLHTGEVTQENGDLHGETVIIATRIEGTAPVGGIHASETVYGVLGTARSELVDRGEFELKGFDAPWRLYEIPVVDDRAPSALGDAERSPYVGRDAELRTAVELVERAVSGRGGTLLVSGEAGAGKSRLLHETADRGRALGMTVLVGHCLDMDAPPPYQPLVEQLDQAARRLSHEQFREVLGEHAPEVARLVPELRRVYDDIDPSPDLPPDQERHYLLHGFGRFVERAARRRPLLLCFEDVHWADESSLQLITSLAVLAVEIPLLIVATYRHDDIGPARGLSRTLEEVTRRRLATEIRLGALSEADVASLLAGRAGETPPPEIASLVFDETEGNPFFVEELFLHLRERGLLFDDRGRWHAGLAIGDTEVPRTVRLVIERRLETIDDDVRAALTAASVVGRSVHFDLLLELTGLGEDSLLDALEAAERARLVETIERDGAIDARFLHEQIRQTLLVGLSAPRRQRLHRRVADAMQAQLGAAADERAADIAHHLQLAGESASRDMTVHFLEVAARNAVAAVAPEDAIRHVDAALDRLRDDELTEQSTLLSIRARARRATGEIDSALDDLATALTLAPSGVAHDEVLGQRARLYLDLFDGRSAADDLDTVLASVRARGDRSGELDTLLALGRAHYVRSLDDQTFGPQARDTYEAAHALAVELDDRRAIVESLLATAWFTDYWADYVPTARANIEEASRIASELGDEGLTVEAASAALRFTRGPHTARRYEELREKLEARHDPVRLKEHYFSLMWFYLRRGELDRCVEICDLGIELARQLGSAPVQYGSLKALALTELGRFDLVDAALDEEVTDEGHPFGQAMQQYARAHFVSALEAWEPAAAIALDAMQRASSLSRVWMQHELVDVGARLAASAGATIASATDEIAAIGRMIDARPSARVRAEVELAAGRIVDARAELASAEQWAVEGGLDHDLAHVLECEARVDATAAEWDSVLSVAARGLALVTRTGQLPLAWKLRGARAQAFEALDRTDEAAAERRQATADFDTLASRIADPVLRDWFVRQPLAARWLRRSDEEGDAS